MGFKKTFKNVFHLLLWSLLAYGMVSCVPSEGDDEANCSEFETFDTKTRSCTNTSTGIAPEATSTSFTIIEDTPTIVTIEYRNTPSSQIATGCIVDNASLNGIAETTNCACNGFGVCTVGISSLPNYTTAGSFNVTFQDEDNVYGTSKNISVFFTAVNDDPVLCPVTLTAVDALDGDDCGGVDCIAPGAPNTPYILGTSPDFTIDNTPNNASEKYYFDSAGDQCYIAGAGAGAWTALNGAGLPTKCDYTTDILNVMTDKPATDCVGGTGNNDCVGAAAPVTNDAPSGTIYFENDSGRCWVYDGNAGAWAAIGTTGEHILPVLEDTATNIGTIYFLDGYDPDGDSLTRSYTDANVNAVGDFNCTNGSSSCTFTPNSNEHYNNDDTDAALEAPQSETITYTVTDPSGGTDSIIVRPIVREVNDVPVLPSNTITVNEDVDISIANANHQTLTLSNVASSTTVQDIDNDTLNSFAWSTNGTDTCNAATSNLNGLATATCDITNKGLFRMTVTGGDATFPVVAGETINMEFFPNPNFNGSATVNYTITDASGGSGTGTFTATFNSVKDKPTFCNFTTSANDAADLCGNIDCSGLVDPDTLSDRNNIPTNEFGFLQNTSGTFASPTFTSGAYDGVTSAIYHDSVADICYISDGAADEWDQHPTLSCAFSVDSDNCGGAGSACTGAGTGDATFPGPAQVGHVYWQNVYPYACYISDGANWVQVTDADQTIKHWVLRTTENVSGATQLTFGTSIEDKLPTFQDIDVTLGDTETHDLEFSNATNGTLTGCGANGAGGNPTGCTGFQPTDGFAGQASFIYSAVDQADATSIGSVKVVVAVEEQSTSPRLEYADGTALNGTTIQANEGSIVQLYNLVVDESSAADTSEDDQTISITITSSNSSVLSTSNIEFFWEDSGQEFLTTKTLTAATGAAQTLISSAGSGSEVEATNTNCDNAGNCDAAENVFGLRLTTTPGNSGTTNVSIVVSDNDATSADTTITFTVVVNAVGVVHGGWDNIHAVGPLVRKEADYRDCDAAGEFTATFTGTANPNAASGTYDPTTVGNVYQETDAEICYESDGTAWLPRGCDYSDSATAGTNCNSADCYGDGAPNYGTPTTTGLRYLDYTNNVCYKSVASDGWYPEGSYVYLAWDDFTISGSTIGGWKVFRKQLDQEFDYSDPVKTIAGNTSSLRKVYDVISSAVKEKGYTYRYQVLPYDANNRLVFPQETYSEVGVLLPPMNQVFVHRRAINKEICTRMGLTPTKTDNNSCSYAGAAGIDTNADNILDTYRQDTNFLMDRFELGCDYTSALNHSSTSCTAGSPCMGTSTPAGAGGADEAYYERDQAICYVVTGGAFEAASASTDVTNQFDDTTFKNFADLPPIVNVNQAKAQSICQARGTNTNIEILPYAVSSAVYTIPDNSYRIPKRAEFVALSAWDDDDTTLSDSTITSTELGSDLNISSKCNSSDANGIDSNFTDSEVPLSAFKHTTPGTQSSTIRQLSTGSDFLENCESKYSIRSLIGNVREWSGERFSTMGIGEQASTLSNPAFNLDDGDESTFTFDTGTTTNASTSGPNLWGAPGQYTWTLANKDNNATKFDLPMGLPLDQASTIPNFQIGQTSGITTSKLHSDDITVDADGGTQTGIISGGSHNSGTGAGRYKADIQDIATADAETGFRCVFPIPVSYTQ